MKSSMNTNDITNTLISGYVQEIRLTSIRIYEGYMPIGILTDQTGEEVGYLSPFRGYSFQVSATFRGDTDLGSSQVFGLNNLLDARLGTDRNLGYQSNLKMDTLKAYLLKLAAKEAIEQWCSRTWHEEKLLGSKFYRVFKDDTEVASYLEKDHELPLMWGATMLDRFIYLCIRWLNPELYELKTRTENLQTLPEKAADYRERATKKDSPNDPEWYEERATFFEAQAKDLEALFAQYTK